MKKVGITTTVPSEILIAAGYHPLDLNNLLVNDSNPNRFLTIAERDGFPLNCCSWIKGIYGICRESDIEDVVCVTGGDCTNTVMLMEVLKLKGFNTIAFAYPTRPDVDDMQRTLDEFATAMGTTLAASGAVKSRLQSCRQLLRELDELTWRENRVSGGENHLWLVSSSDFNGDHEKFERELAALVQECSQRQPYPSGELRLAYIGVPAVYARELYRYLERHGARVVFNEFQRQFAMPDPGKSLAEQYTSYTYPYSVQERLADIKPQLKKRRIDGIIHYTQAFCHRGIGDIIFRDALELPVLTLEGNDDFTLNNHVKTRLEAFLDMLERKRLAARSGSRLDGE
jgi:benzoyl-CoA reductase/2-hydroxyglutaryl-CoA dehydratase subunit BcrC/BadD/HgdB